MFFTADRAGHDGFIGHFVQAMNALGRLVHYSQNKRVKEDRSMFFSTWCVQGSAFQVKTNNYGIPQSSSSFHIFFGGHSCSGISAPDRVLITSATAVMK